MDDECLDRGDAGVVGVVAAGRQNENCNCSASQKQIEVIERIGYKLGWGMTDPPVSSGQYEGNDMGGREDVRSPVVALLVSIVAYQRMTG